MAQNLVKFIFQLFGNFLLQHLAINQKIVDILLNGFLLDDQWFKA